MSERWLKSIVWSLIRHWRGFDLYSNEMERQSKEWNREATCSDSHITNHIACVLKNNCSLLLAISIIQVKDDGGLDYDSSGTGIRSSKILRGKTHRISW